MNSKEFLSEIWSEQGSGFGFICLRADTRSWRDIAVKVPEQLDEMPLPDVGEGDIYFSPNLFVRPHRRKGLMLASCWLYADLDAVDPYLIDEEYEPTIAWESSPKRYQALWHIRQWLEPETHGKINRKLTYFLNADKGGWDATQVLRLPGTLNYKYESRPQVELLWEGAEPVRSWKRVVKYQLPNYSVPTPETRIPTNKVVLPAAVRHKLIARTASGDRSKVLWRLEQQLLECGLDAEQVFMLLRGSVWNKWPDAPELLEREIARAIEYRSAR